MMPDQAKAPTTEENWSQHLTPELRAHFERVGEDSVQFDVSNHRYRLQEKQFAALAWLGEKRRNRERLNRWMFFAVVATLFVALLTLVATIWLGLR